MRSHRPGSACFKLGLAIALGFLASVQPVEAQSSTLFTGYYSASGTASGCSSSDVYTASGTSTSTVQPSPASLAATGGQFAGSYAYTGTFTFCGVVTPTSGSGTLTGEVAI